MAKLSTPTLADVAAHAGVSSATVSRTLNFPDLVRQDTRKRVETAVRELGYSPHFGARYLASNRTNTVGAVIPTMDNAIFAHALQSLQETLTETGTTLLVATSNYDAAREEEQITALISRGVDGMVLIGQYRSSAIYDMMQGRGLPYVLMWSYLPDSPHACAGFNNFEAAAGLARKVLSLGHRKIAMIAGHTNGNDRAAERVRGVRATLADAGLSLEPPFYTECSYRFEDSARVTRVLLELEDRPTALICGNDVIAAGAIQQARSMGIMVPQDVSVVGFDDIDLAGVISPALTTVRVPHRRMGATAARLLMDMIRDGAPARSIELKTELVERESLGPAPVPNGAGKDRPQAHSLP